jgi:DNA-binding transcriptional LysR family regulator
VADLEGELGIKLFSREGRIAKLTPEGQVFYEEALKTLAQAERSIITAQRAAEGEIGTFGIGFMGFTACLFLPSLIRKYKDYRSCLQRQWIFTSLTTRAEQYELSACHC